MMPIEYTFVQDFLKRIHEKKQLQTDHILNTTLLQMDYAERRGYVQALGDAEAIINELKSLYFPDYPQ